MRNRELLGHTQSLANDSLQSHAAVHTELRSEIISRRDEEAGESIPFREKSRNNEKSVREKPPRVRKDTQGKLPD